MKIAVLSDTHGLLRPGVLEIISDCDAVVHAGDINSQKIIDEMQTAAKPGTPFYIVRGNNDKEWAEKLPCHEEFVIDGIRFYMVHNKKDLPVDTGRSQIVVFGHSHRYLEEVRDGQLWLNPGSCGKRRFNQDITMAVIDTEEIHGKEKCSSPVFRDLKWHEITLNGEKSCAVARVDFSHSETEKQSVSDRKNTMAVPGEEEALLDSIIKIMKRMDKRQQVGKIAEDLKLDAEFVEQICRIRVTHPGVTAHGILDKMEVNRTGR